jgi:hypothetical protein
MRETVNKGCLLATLPVDAATIAHYDHDLLEAYPPIGQATSALGSYAIGISTVIGAEIAASQLSQRGFERTGNLLRRAKRVIAGLGAFAYHYAAEFCAVGLGGNNKADFLVGMATILPATYAADIATPYIRYRGEQQKRRRQSASAW